MQELSKQIIAATNLTTITLCTAMVTIAVMLATQRRDNLAIVAWGIAIFCAGWIIQRGNWVIVLWMSLMGYKTDIYVGSVYTPLVITLGGVLIWIGGATMVEPMLIKWWGDSWPIRATLCVMAWWVFWFITGLVIT